MMQRKKYQPRKKRAITPFKPFPPEIMFLILQIFVGSSIPNALIVWEISDAWKMHIEYMRRYLFPTWNFVLSNIGFRSFIDKGLSIWNLGLFYFVLGLKALLVMDRKSLYVTMKVPNILIIFGKGKTYTVSTIIHHYCTVWQKNATVLVTTNKKFEVIKTEAGGESVPVRELNGDLSFPSKPNDYIDLFNTTMGKKTIYMDPELRDVTEPIVILQGSYVRKIVEKLGPIIKETQSNRNTRCRVKFGSHSIHIECNGIIITNVLVPNAYTFQGDVNLSVLETWYFLMRHNAGLKYMLIELLPESRVKIQIVCDKVATYFTFKCR